MRRILVCLVVTAAVGFFLSSCARGITPYQAAHGKAKCGKYVR